MRVVCDASTTLAWTRPPVGIVRTEHEFLRYVASRPDLDVAFCRFDGASRRHVEVPRAQLDAALSRRQAAAAESPPLEPAVGGGAPATSRRLRTRAWAAGATRRWIERLPDALRADAWLVARKSDELLRGMYWLGRSATRATLSRRRSGAAPAPAPAPPSEPAFGFRPSDCYVSMGLDWQFNDLGALWARKRAVRFRTVLYCYDLIPVFFPHLMSFDARQYYAHYFVNLAHCADRVAALSEATRRQYLDFLAELGGPVPPIRVVPPGAEVRDVAAAQTAAPPHPALAHAPFVLCVCTIEPRKNHQLLYNVWDRLAAVHGERLPYLVFAGMVGWGVNDLLARLQVNPRLAGRILVLDHVDDAGLSWLYRECRFTVFPSFCEGWGLPVVESLALGKACLASNHAAVVEASQGLVPALDPLDFRAWYDHVERWLLDPEALAADEARVRAGYVPRSWAQHGEDVLALVADLDAPGRTRSAG